jgi:hypothetical protein
MGARCCATFAAAILSAMFVNLCLLFIDRKKGFRSLSCGSCPPIPLFGGSLDECKLCPAIIYAT